MFLAPAWNVQEYEVAEVQAGVLAAEVGVKPRPGRREPQIPPKTWLESSDCDVIEYPGKIVAMYYANNPRLFLIQLQRHFDYSISDINTAFAESL